MKRCSNCGQTVTGDCNFCPNRGGKCAFDPQQTSNAVMADSAPETETAADIAENEEAEAESFAEDVHTCPRCGEVLEGDFTFCPYCGANLSLCGSAASSGIKNIADSVKVEVKHAEQKLKENEFVRSVQDDFKNSRSVEMVKNAVGGAVNSASAGIKAKSNSGILKIVLPIAAVVIVILAVVLNIHTCEECGDVYFGKKNTISFWGESESVCKDCYNDFYMW